MGFGLWCRQTILELMKSQRCLFQSADSIRAESFLQHVLPLKNSLYLLRSWNFSEVKCCKNPANHSVFP